MMGQYAHSAELLQRILLPRPGEPVDVRSLYVVEESGARRPHPTSRTAVRVGADTEVSFATYFNAFPASYWRRWTVLERVALRVRVRGSGRIDLYRSKIDGARIAIEGQTFSAGAEVAATTDVEIVTDLGPFEDGGWLWFDLTADSEVELLSAGWYALETVDTPRRVVVGIPTFNRPDDAVAALEALATDGAVDAVIDRIVMPDQGTNKVSAHPGFAAAAAHFAGRLEVYDQPNLGGSGGYARIMYEALRRTTAPYILYMDDDIEIEPDSVLRALAFSRFARTPMLVGGQMLNLQERSHLHVMGEVVGRHNFMWTNAPYTEYDHDFAAYPLTDRDESAALHRRIDVDYNGWWMCMIPRTVAETVGLPLPLFIKWDDTEFGLRAQAAGFPTATVPGVAIWHMSWSDKDDAIDWQAYFHLRNRLIVAALHHDGDYKGILMSLLKGLCKHLSNLEYSTVAIQIEALRDFLRGPEALPELLPTALPKVRAIRAEYPDAVVLRSATDLPAPSGWAGSRTKPPNVAAKVAALAAVLVHSLRPADPRHHTVPQANFPPIEAHWFTLSRLDGATVTTADGRGVVYRKRDRAIATELLRTALALYRELYRRFPEMRRRYRDAHAQLTSKEAWSRVFDTP